MSKEHRRDRDGNGNGRPGAPSAFERAAAALGWPGLYGWLGTGFGVAGLWFVASALALRSNASKMADASPPDGGSPEARAAAERSRSLGFGEWFLFPVLRASRAGIAIRESLGPGSRGVDLRLERAPSLGRLGRVTMTSRPGSAPVGYANAHSPFWLKLVRRGDVFEGFHSRDGATWQRLGERETTLRVKRRACVGFFVRPPGSEACSARFDRVSITPETETAAPPFRDPPAGGEASVGGVEKGSAEFSGDSVLLTAGPAEVAAPRAGGDLPNDGGAASDSSSKATRRGLRFVYAELEGDCELVARVSLPDPARAFPDPLAGDDLVRARLGVQANARASGVFGAFALVVAAFWWGFRRFEPSLRRKAAHGPAGPGDGDDRPRR